MVTLAKSSQSRSTPRPSQKESATVMLAMRIVFEIFEAPEMVALVLLALVADSAVLWLEVPF
jgi:hypothetical protein